jgi:hypothetical protein
MRRLRLADAVVAFTLCAVATWLVPASAPQPAAAGFTPCYSNQVLGLAWDCKFGWLDDGAGLGNYNYDFGSQTAVASNADFPDAVLFYNFASVTRVLSSLPADWSTNFGGIETGSTKWGLLRHVSGSTFDWSPSKGFKNHNGLQYCGTTSHIRPYAPVGPPYMYNTKFGYFVFATAHNDINEVCVGMKAYYGETEQASDAVGRAYLGKATIKVHPDWGNLHNRETLMVERDHVYENDGLAVYIRMD